MRAFQQAGAPLRGQPIYLEGGRIDGAATRPDAANRSLADLLRRQPRLVIAGAAEGAVPRALLYRLARRHSRLLVWCDGVPPPWRCAQRLALHLADGVLVRNEADEAKVAALRKSDGTVFNVPGPYPIADFLGLPPVRQGDSAYRILVSGALDPGGDAMTILHAAAQWAERTPQRRIELSWLGEGDLRHVLAAQSLPENLVQRFPGALAAAEKCGEFARSGVLIAAASAHDRLSREDVYIAEAMAAGLVVLFDRGSRKAARLVQERRSGIGFDATAPATLLQAIAGVMSASEAALDAMRGAARLRILPMDTQGFAERLERAVAAVMRNASGGTAAGGRHALRQVAEAQ